MGVLRLNLSMVVLVLAMAVVADAAHAQYAPVPKSAPRTPVKRELLNGKNGAAIPESRILEGKATFLDAERLKIGDVEMRLYGVVPPQMGASYGPQARAVVDALAQASVFCRIQDRARDGQYMAVCKNDNGLDFGMELLRRGLAATARGTLQSSDLGPAYLAAEQAAQMQRLGIWSATLPGALSDKVIKDAVAKVEAAKADAVAKAEADAEAKIKAAAAKAETAQEALEVKEKAATESLALSAGALMEPIATTAAAMPPYKPDAKILELGPTAADVQAALSAPAAASPVESESVSEGTTVGFFERYQILTTGILGLLAALSITGGFIYRANRDRREDLRALAAALRGELMAARSICLARLSKLAHEPEEKNMAWPRLRTLVFQAYVGRLGHLGADLARQISSIYGQASDYASYYVGAEARPELASKKQALQTLVHHIEEVMPRLTQVESSGFVPCPAKEALPNTMLSRILRPMTTTAARHLPSSSGGGGRTQERTLAAPESIAAPAAPQRSAIFDALPDVKAEMTSEQRSPAIRAKHRAIADARVLADASPVAETKAAAASQPQDKGPVSGDDTVVLKKDILQNMESEAAQKSAEAQGLAMQETPILHEPKEDVVAAKPAQQTEAKVGSEESADSKKNSTVQPQTGKTKVEDVKPTVIAGGKADTKTSFAAKANLTKAAAGPVATPAEAMAGINFKAPIFEKLSRIKMLASAQIDRLKPQPIEDLLPDYANLTEEELEALSYAEAYLAACTPKNERKTG